LKHKERVNIANNLTDRILKRFRDDILLGGIYGSTAKNTDVEYSDLEMLFVVKNDSKAQSFSFAYKGMPIAVTVQKLVDVEGDVREIELDWPLKMGRLFNLRLTCGDASILKRLRSIIDKIPKGKFYDYVARETPLCYEGLGRLKAVKIRGNTHETGLFVAEVLMEFMLLIALFNRKFINHDYLGGLPESFKFKQLPKDYEKTARELMNWTSLSIDDIIQFADHHVKNFVNFMAENGIKVKEHTPLEKVETLLSKPRSKYEVLSIK